MAALALGAGFGCHEKANQAAPAPSLTAPEVVVAAPAGLLFRGAIRQPADAWKQLQEVLGGRTRLLPSHLGLAIASAFFDSPLSAGLIDESAPVALVVVDEAGSGTGLVGAVHLTSGRELLAALTTGSDAKFVAKRDAEHGLTLIRPTAGEPRLAIGVVGDHAIFGASEADVVSAGPFLARKVAPAIGAGAAFELVASKESLAGPLSQAARASLGSLRERLVVADAEGRKQHAGRAPDFGEPGAVIAAVSSLGEGVVAVLGSAEELRITGTFSEGLPLVRIELSPDWTGRARELTRTLPVGDLSALLTLPDWVDAVLLNRSGEPGGAAIADRLENVLGSRLMPKERDRTRSFVTKASRALGAVQAVGLFEAQSAGLFVLGPSGDSAALREAVLSLPDVARAKAISEPLETFLGRAAFTRVNPKPGTDEVAELRLRGSPGAAKGGATSNRDISIIASSAGERVALVAAAGDVGPNLRGLLAPERGRTLATDTAIARAVARAGAEADAAVCLGVRSEDGNRSFAVLTAGSNRRVTWAEVGAGKAAFRLLARSFVDR